MAYWSNGISAFPSSAVACYGGWTGYGGTGWSDGVADFSIVVYRAFPAPMAD